MHDLRHLPTDSPAGGQLHVGDTFCDAEGLCYRWEEDGWVCTGPPTKALFCCSLAEGTVRIAERAFFGCKRLTTVQLPSTLREIGPCAFAWCGKLEQVSLPDSLEVVGPRAFYQTRLAQFVIPASLKDVGDEALALAADDPGKPAEASEQQGPILQVVENPVNSTFYLRNSILCQWVDPAHTTARAVVYVGTGGVVHIPDEVVRVAARAFDTQAAITELVMHPGLCEVGTDGMKMDTSIAQVTVVGPGGQDAKLFPSPEWRCGNTFKEASEGSHVDFDRVVYLIDFSLRYNTFARGITRCMLKRMENGVMLADLNRAWYERYIGERLDECLVSFAQAEDTEAIGQLVDLGFVNRDNIDRLVQLASACGHVKAAGYLLHAKRDRLGAAAVDYSL